MNYSMPFWSSLIISAVWGASDKSFGPYFQTIWLLLAIYFLMKKMYE